MAAKLNDNELLLQFERKRVHMILAGLEAMASGDLTHKLPLSSAHDELDAIAHAVNVLADELLLARKTRAI
jgi:methyl-accepting chemotaxis protein